MGVETLKIKGLTITIDTDDPESYSLKDGKLEMKMHIKGPKFEGDITIGKWICFDCKALNDLDLVYCAKCNMSRTVGRK